MIVFVSKIIVFFYEVTHHKPIVYAGEYILSIFDNFPKFELLFVMVLVPVTFNSI
jgi:hypothetical protein